MLIFLVGYMGCGKSTFGRWFSKRLDASFIDTDHLIEKNEGCSISDIFENKGESHFRDLEHKTVSELESTDKITIIATGGGLPCHRSNMELMNQKGITVYLFNRSDQLASNLEYGKSKRPLIRDLSQQELIEFIDRALESRKEYYNKAQLVVDCYGSTNEYIANHIESYIDFLQKK